MDTGQFRASILTPNVASMLWNTAATFPDRPAIVAQGERVSYRDLRARAAAFAASLLEMGVAPGDRVGIFLDRGADAAAAYFGAAAVGAIAVNLNESLRPRQVEHVLGHSGATVLVTSAAMIVRQPRPLVTSAAMLDVISVAREADLQPVARTGGDVAQIIYTSGTTGMPKGVTLSHANVWAWANAVVDYLEIVPGDRIASLLPFSYVYGFNQLLCAISSGACLVVDSSPLPQEILNTLQTEEITVLAAVPPLWLQLLNSPGLAERPLPALRVMTNAGGRIPVDAVRKLRDAQPSAKLYLMYGSTEALRSTYLDPADVDGRPNSIGRAIPGAEILILRDDLQPCAVDEVGELVQRGPTVAMGYWDDPEATARVFCPNPLAVPGAPVSERVVFTGDLVRRDADGFLYHMGRRDKLIKTLGYRLSPDEVVDALYASGEIVEAVVSTEPDPRRGERIIAHVVLKSTGTLKGLEMFCRTELPRYMQPARIIPRDEIPRTSSGKHDLLAMHTPTVAA